MKQIGGVPFGACFLLAGDLLPGCLLAGIATWISLYGTAGIFPAHREWVMAEYSELQQRMIANWDRHGYCEFVLNDPDETIKTMSDNPYILAVPLGQLLDGRKAVYEFYRDEFLCKVPKSVAMQPLQRSVSDTHIVDEFIFSFDHECEMPWKLPGIAPTGRHVEIPMVVIVGFEGDKIAYEHLYWDHAQVLHQIGVVDAPEAAVGGETLANLRKKVPPHG